MAEVKAHQTKARYPSLGKVVDGRYHLIGGLGQGGLGTVYLAQHLHLEQLFAVKFLDLETVGIDADKRQKKEYQTDFMKEAKVASMIRHESVVKVIDFGEFEGLPYLVMEYVPGPSLLQMITERGRFSVPEATSIALCIARALSAFHERQLVHRDLKPANVIMDPRGGGQLTLVDLGLVKDISGPAGRASTHPTALRGTPGYLAPEQVPSWVLSGIGHQVAGGKKLVDARVDMYALGVIFYEMLAGVSPYPDGSNTSIIIYACTKPPLPITGVEPPVKLIPGLEALIYDTMAREPERRPQTASAFIKRLENLSRVPSPRESWPIVMPPTSGASPIQPVRSHHRAVAAPGTRPLGMYPNGYEQQTDAVDVIDDDPFYTAHDGATSLQDDMTYEFDGDSLEGYIDDGYLSTSHGSGLSGADDYAVTRIESLDESPSRPSSSRRSHSNTNASHPHIQMNPPSRTPWVLLPIGAIFLGACIWYFALRPSPEPARKNDVTAQEATTTPVNQVPGTSVQPTSNAPKATMALPANVTKNPGPTPANTPELHRAPPPVQPDLNPTSRRLANPSQVSTNREVLPPRIVLPKAPRMGNEGKAQPSAAPTKKTATNVKTIRPSVKAVTQKPKSGAVKKRSRPKMNLDQLQTKAQAAMQRLDWKGCYKSYSKWLQQAGKDNPNYYTIESRMTLCRNRMKNGR